MARREKPIPTGRIRRTARVGTLVGTQAARGAATRAANVARSEEARREALERRRLLLSEKATAEPPLPYPTIAASDRQPQCGVAGNPAGSSRAQRTGALGQSALGSSSGRVTRPSWGLYNDITAPRSVRTSCIY